jgi:hypothetical protein
MEKSQPLDTRNSAGLALKLAAKDFALDAFVQAALLEESVRDEIVRLMVTQADIMVYYHCFYVVSQASQARPDLFYAYWPAIAPLLNHENSYHRDFALTILANLTAVDKDHLFLAVYEGYFAALHDEKFMTARCCVQNAVKVAQNLPELRDPILAQLLDLEAHCRYPANQKALLKYEVLVFLEAVYAAHPHKERLIRFIQAEGKSLSPKTRRKAKELIRKFNL